MDAVAIVELLQALVTNTADDRTDDYQVLPSADAGLVATSPAFVLMDRRTGREWLVSVTLRAR